MVTKIPSLTNDETKMIEMIDQLIRLLENAPDVKSIPELIADARYLEEKLSRKKDEPEPYITSEIGKKDIFSAKSPNFNVRIFSNG